MPVNTESLVPWKVARFGGQCDWDDPTQLANGVAIVCQNMQFLAESVKTRWGLRSTTKIVDVVDDPTGVDVLTVLGNPSAPKVVQQAGGASISTSSLNPNALVGNKQGSFQPIAPNTQVGIVFTAAGDLYLELPAGSGNLTPLTNIAASLVSILPAGAVMQSQKTNNRIYMAFTDLIESLGPVLALDAATGFVSPASQNPIAAPWKPDTFYQEGDIVTPVNGITLGDPSPVTTITRNGGIVKAVVPAISVPNGLTFNTGDTVRVAAVTDASFDLNAATIIEIDVARLGSTIVAYNVFWFQSGPDTQSTAGTIKKILGGSDVGVWFRRMVAGISGPTEPLWPIGLGFFTPGLVPSYATATDDGVGAAWQEWTPGFPAYLPSPPPVRVFNNPGGGSIPVGQDVYICLSLSNDLGESAWSQPVTLLNTGANDILSVSYFSTLIDAGWPMPSWLMSVMESGTIGELHWPASPCVNIYVAAVAHNAAAPTQYRFYGATNADTSPVIDAIPSGTLLSPRTSPTAAISTQLFKGEAGTRNAIVLRQDTMGNLSPVDPRAVMGVNFSGAAQQRTTYITRSGAGLMTVGLSDITSYAPGMAFTITNASDASLNGTYTITTVQAGGLFPFPGGFLYATSANHTPQSSAQTGTVSTTGGACPVAVLPTGSTEAPGYSYDVVALTVVGLGSSGPFNYLASATPASPFASLLTYEAVDGVGNAYAVVKDASGFTPGEVVLISGWTGSPATLNGQRTLAGVNGSANVVTFPEPAGNQSRSNPSPAPSITVVQTLPTQALAGTLGFPLQFDDTSLAEGLDVTGNLLFVAVPPATDLAYLPSVDRMAYVSDQYPTSLIFSEADFLGEVDGLNGVLTVEPSNGAHLVGARELKNGMIIACKRNGGYQVIPTGDEPANWGLNRLWGGYGPQSGRNIATGRDGTTGLNWFIFVDPEAGVFRWPPLLGEKDRELDWLSEELSGANNQEVSRQATWDRVNRAAGEQIQVVIDDIAKELKIAVPLDGATTPNYILTMSYFNGWQSPLIPTLSGDWVANRQARRWNLDPIPTRCMAMVQRTLVTLVDQRVNYHQLLLGVTGADQLGLQYMEPGAYDDFGQGYVARYRPAYARDPQTRVLRFSAVSGQAIGSGKLSIQPVTHAATYAVEPKTVDLTTTPESVQTPGGARVVAFGESVKADSEFVTCEFSNGGRAGEWFQLLEVTEWYRPLFPNR